MANPVSERIVTKGKLRDAVRRLAYLGRALQLTWDAAKGWTIMWLLILGVQGLLPAATVYLTKILVDRVAAVVGGGFSWELVQPVILPAALMALALLLIQVLQGIINWIHTAQAELIQDHVKALIHRQAAYVDLEFYETPEYFDHMARANGQADSRPLSILNNVGNLLKSTITMVAIAALLLRYSIWLPLVLVISTLPALWFVLRHNRLHHDWWEETTEKQRWVHYYDQVLTIRQFAAELRIFRLNTFFHNAYVALRRELRESRLRLMRNQSLANFGAGVMAFLVTGGVMAWMVWRAMRGAATLGDLALFYQAFNQGQGLMRTLLSGVGQLYTDTLFLEHLFTFLELEPKVKNSAKPLPLPSRLQSGLEIKEVDFRYPGSDRLALRDFSLTIPAGKIVAVVGPNGAGKSTLLKLICRFYDPEKGSVEWDGIDIREFDTQAYWRRITVLFQDFVNYAGTVADSIAIGDLSAERDLARLEAAAVAGGGKEVVDQLPKGFDTILGKQFRGGVDLSGGQFQRVALSRTLYRQSQIVLLDEPTSYMDSWAEALWLNRFCAFVEDRTAVIVTHRFTTAMRADIIYVMDEGRIVEAGNHDELLAQGGLYAASWTTQVRSQTGEEV